MLEKLKIEGKFSIYKFDKQTQARHKIIQKRIPEVENRAMNLFRSHASWRRKSYGEEKVLLSTLEQRS